ncbi:MAG: nucleotide sugar dehydrogenase [bacterium]|nr:nucleotide sugar dehydrogenase [bacterium]
MTLITGQAASAQAATAIDELEARIRDRVATIGVVGLGYVGLPLAVEFAKAYPKVIGCDMNPDRVEMLAGGRSHIADVPHAEVAEAVGAERFLTSTDMSLLGGCDAIVICVPTPLEKSKDPDLSYVRGAAKAIADALRPGQLVILESTTYPGTTDELLLPLFAQNGLQLDRDFLLAFSPERVDPGSTYALRDIPKVVGGCSERSTAVACELYGSIVNSVHPVSSARVAETVKLLENTFRLVNIGLINEFALLCSHLGIDSGEVIGAAATKPFGFMPFFPGPGVGGHCIPLDPLYLSWKAQQQGFISRFIDLADQINSQMPAHVVELVMDALNSRAKAMRDSRILIVGVAYKNDIDDTRQSPAIAVIDRLRARGAYVAYHDPLVPVLDFDFHDWPEWRPRVTLPSERRSLRVANHRAFSRRRRYDMLESMELTPKLLADTDCVVILAKHRSVDYAMIAQHADLVVDTRDAISAELRASARAQVVRL